MFEKLADFWDIIIFAFLVLMLGSLQLRYATSAEVVVALGALVCAVGLLLVKKWAVIGLDIVFLTSVLVYFSQIWFQSIIHSNGGYVLSNILKIVVVCLLLWYIGRKQMEERFVISDSLAHGTASGHGHH